MRPNELFALHNRHIQILHLTWIAFFVSFYAWFNMAPLANTMVETVEWLTLDHISTLLILNVALTIPARMVIGMLLDKFGPRIVFSLLLVTMSAPIFLFAFGTTWAQLAVSRLLISGIGASFVVGIRLVAEWYPPEKVGFAEGFYAGFGNFGSAFAAMTLPFIATTLFPPEIGWRYAVAFSGVLCVAYGAIFFFTASDTPPGKVYEKPKKIAALEVSSWRDMILLIIWTVPLFAALGIVAWKIYMLGFINRSAAYLIAVLIILNFFYQAFQTLRVNIPRLKAGVTEADKYRFQNVAALNTTYFANFGAELAIVSMLPLFFLTTFHLSATQAGLIASSFAFVNLLARPLGGWFSDRMKSRKAVMLIYIAGIVIGLILMGLITSAWPIPLAIAATIFTSFFIQGAEGATFAIIPLIKKRLTGQISGMAGAYGNVGAVIYLTLYTFVTPNQFFFILASGALLSFVYCVIFLREPESGH
ncbi:MFS transporter, NNP family, nitrate/nitrite transporter [Evansella caseinilytica]|uniref:MFS transporter, NNP family, nitrate/nitrite transporter n=1 Tax=Evansella caseinilytica TaxID=1503961 RepID=A0A1H3SZ40_9BACI|nr:MFS transporter [Evansella caseinilytica]SDZ43050.1 MFS transporter, NNP family, nitrate/nitrite transporter [Evansella caseinilytica]